MTTIGNAHLLIVDCLKDGTTTWAVKVRRYIK